MNIIKFFLKSKTYNKPFLFYNKRQKGLGENETRGVYAKKVINNNYKKPLAGIINGSFGFLIYSAQKYQLCTLTLPS